MEDYKISDILFKALSQPKPVEYLSEEGRKSGYSEFVFWRMLLDALVHYYNVIQNKITEFNNVGNAIADYKLALFTITNGKYSNHFGKNDVSYLADLLKELAKHFCLPEHIYFSAYPLHDTNYHVGYIENELNNLNDREIKIKFLSLHIEKTQIYIDNLIKISVEHPSLKIEGERADRLSKARAFLEFLNVKKTVLLNTPPQKIIIVEPKGGIAASNRLLASAAMAVKVFNPPYKYDVFSKQIPGFSKSYFEIDNILSEDNNGPFIFPVLIKKTKDLISIIPSDLKMDFIESMKLQISSFRIKKLNELKYDDSYYIDHTPIQMGIHTEQSRFVKASKESIELKLNLLNEYDSWLAKEEEQHFKKRLPIMTNNDSNSVALEDNGKVLNRDDYFKIILEIYNLHRDTLDTYLTDKYNKLISKNPLFVACLYKDINKVMEGVHKEGEPDLLIENGDFVIEYGDLKLTGNPSIFDDAMTWLWAKLMEGFVNNTSLNTDKDNKQMETDLGKIWQTKLDKTSELITNFENEFLKRNDYTPTYAKKIAELNKELKAAQLPVTNKESKTPNLKLMLSDISISDDAYKTIISLLTDKGYCQKDTLKWKDKAKGNKGLLIAILKDLQAKGYYKDGISLNKEDYKTIAKNTFDWTGSIDTVKKAKPEKFRLDFIIAYNGK